MADTNSDVKRNKTLGAILLLMLASMVISGYVITPL